MKRIQYLDIAKGILIVLLVFAHFRSCCTRVDFESEYFRMVYGWNHIFTCFYMPAFFFISGYCSNFNKPFKEFVVTLSKNLLLPCLSLNVIMVLLSSLIYQLNLIDELFLSVIHGGGLWFLNALIIGKLINYVTAHMPNGECILLLLLIIGVSLCHFNIGQNVFYYQHGLVASFWIGIGNMFRQNNTWYDIMLRWSVPLYPIIAIATFYKPVSFVGIDKFLSLGSLPFHVLYALIGSFFLLSVCKRIGKNRFLEYWGKNTLVVYALHFIPLFFLMKKLWIIMEPDNGVSFFLYFIVLYALEYGACYLLIIFFQHRPFRYFVGKF